jgi:hypothetical protein
LLYLLLFFWLEWFLKEKGWLSILDLRVFGLDTDWSFAVLVLPVCPPDATALEFSPWIAAKVNDN